MKSLSKLALLLPLFLTGCGSLDKIEQATQNIVKAAKAVDVVGLNERNAKIDKLQAEVEKLHNRLISAPGGSPLVVLKDRFLALEVVQYTGSLRINSWIDNTNNRQFIDRRLYDTNVTLGISPTTFMRRHPEYFVTRQEPFFIATAYEQYADEAFARFLKNTALIPGPNPVLTHLHNQLQTLGSHTVFVEVTPIHPDKNRRWSLRGRLITHAIGGKAETLKEFDIDSDKYQRHSMNTPVPALPLFITVTSQ